MTDTLERREAIARVIDPKSWAIHDSWAAWLRGEGERPDDAEQCAMMRRSYERRMPGLVAASLAKADKIAALTTSPRVDAPHLFGAFRTTESGGGKFTMTFKFPTMQAMHAADDEWRQLRKFIEGGNGWSTTDIATTAANVTTTTGVASDTLERREAMQGALAVLNAIRAGRSPQSYDLTGCIERMEAALATTPADPRVGKIEADLEAAKKALERIKSGRSSVTECATIARSTLSQIEGS